ncbi:hypothetical protein [Stakelama tenebrarum]|uniref:Uncharacterized protein n=1 Tax=Stakelama tenebrarum TaxID=2711215 RepID=A0A6G6Y8B8_9SPHN|nr:hypothetical protein [Sphingosinithalassobacter tenebrarum]QIG80816.1 hypothetical protein G5C33_14145 [Sphingosinithalassobacter tenebrarum]
MQQLPNIDDVDHFYLMVEPPFLVMVIVAPHPDARPAEPAVAEPIIDMDLPSPRPALL